VTPHLFVRPTLPSTSQLDLDNRGLYQKEEEEKKKQEQARKVEKSREKERNKISREKKNKDQQEAIETQQRAHHP
jgi:hypothetical protein